MISRTTRLTRIGLFAALLAVAAFIRLPIGPVPLTMQSFAAQLTGYHLGARDGALAVALYIAIGLLGFPVFSAGGGPAYVLAPTFGYLVGFAVCAIITGSLARFNHRGSIPAAFAILGLGLTGIYSIGVLWLFWVLSWTTDAPAPVMGLLASGLFIPLAEDIVLTIPAAFLAVRLGKIPPR